MEFPSGADIFFIRKDGNDEASAENWIQIFWASFYLCSKTKALRQCQWAVSRLRCIAYPLPGGDRKLRGYSRVFFGVHEFCTSSIRFQIRISGDVGTPAGWRLHICIADGRPSSSMTTSTGSDQIFRTIVDGDVANSDVKNVANGDVKKVCDFAQYFCWQSYWLCLQFYGNAFEISGGCHKKVF